MAFTYGDITAAAGGTGGTYKELTLLDGEYVTEMQVCKAKKTSLGTYRISYVKFTTNLGRTLEGGTYGNDNRTFTAPEGYAVAGVHGASGDEIDRLGIICLLIS